MKLGQIIAAFRREADDAVAPYLASDDDAKAWANEAVAEACRRSPLIVDSSTVSICTLTAVAGEPWIPYDDRIVHIRRAKPTGQPAVPVIALEDMDDWREDWEAETGTDLIALVSRMETWKFRAYPVLTADRDIALTVQRVPLGDMDDLDNDEPEIP
ncbi:MAG: hypothetical protein AB7N65_14190 [Vicinamibacterales bacterium]